MTSKHECFQEIFMKNLTEYEAVLVERSLIEMLILLRHPLLNIQMRGVCQRDGIERAKLEGKYKGRQRIKINGSLDTLYPRWKNKEIRTKEFMKALNLKHRTFYRRISEYEQQNNITCIKTENLNTIHHENIKNMQDN